MPEYNMVVESRPYKVDLVKKEGKGQFEANVNDKPVDLKLEESEASVPSTLALRVAGKKYLVELGRIDRRALFTLRVNDRLFHVQFKERAKRELPTGTTVPVIAMTERRRGTATLEGSVVAPMAGKIVYVKVKKGDTVKAGDVVCILEAMKMENEINATKDGKVQEVKVAEGTPVNEGDVLAIIE